MKFNATYGIGDVVYLKLRSEKFPGMVTAVRFTSGTLPMYQVSWNDGDAGYYCEIELTETFIKTFEE